MTDDDRFYGEDAPVPVFTYCCRCEDPIYQGDDALDTDAGLVCEGCAIEDEWDEGVRVVAGMSDGMNWDGPVK